MTFEHFIADLASRFAGLPSGRVHAEIEHALTQLVEFLGTERASLYELLPDRDAIAVTKTWARPGVDAIPPPLVLDGLVPWYNERLRKGETLRFDRIPEDVAVEGHREREYALAHGMRSHVCIPLAVNGRWMCALGSATITHFFSFSDSTILQVRAVGQILATFPIRVPPLRHRRENIAQFLDRCGWRINGVGNAAEQLGLHPNTLRSRLKRLGVERPASPARRTD